MVTAAIVGIIILAITIGAYYIIGFFSSRLAFQIELVLFVIINLFGAIKNHKWTPKRLFKPIDIIAKQVSHLVNKIKTNRRLKNKKQKTAPK
jgi:membrane protein implicated in regulation of membrane protease activity